MSTLSSAEAFCEKFEIWNSKGKKCEKTKKGGTKGKVEKV